MSFCISETRLDTLRGFRPKYYKLCNTKLWVEQENVPIHNWPDGPYDMVNSLRPGCYRLQVKISYQWTRLFFLFWSHLNLALQPIINHNTEGRFLLFLSGIILVTFIFNWWFLAKKIPKKGWLGFLFLRLIKKLSELCFHELD